MAAVWSDAARFGRWLEIELLATEAPRRARRRAGRRRGGLPRATRRSSTRRSSQAVLEREAVTDHDVAAFVDVVQAAIGAPAGSWIHYGLTSSRRRRHRAGAGRCATPPTCCSTQPTELLRRSSTLARTHRDTVMIGRTHGIHAEPTTFGAKVALWALQLDRDRTRLDAAARGRSRCASSSGRSARTPTSIRPSRRFVGDAPRPDAGAGDAGDRPRPSRRVPLGVRRRSAATCELIAVELRHLQRTEVARGAGGVQGGPEGLVGDAAQAQPDLGRDDQWARPCRAVQPAGRIAGCRPVARTGHLALARSSGSSCPTGRCSSYYMLRRLRPAARRAAGRSPDRMRDNLRSSHGLVFSQPVLLALVAAGSTRDDAYRIVQRNAMRAWDERRDFRSLLENDPEVDARRQRRLDEAFDLDRARCATSTGSRRARRLRPPHQRRDADVSVRLASGRCRPS